MKKITLTLALLAGLPLALAAQVTKEDIKKLTTAGISDDVILSYVKANGGVARLSADDIIELKQAGASEKVLSVVLGQAPAAAPAYPQQQQQAPATQTYERAYSAPSTTYVYDSNAYYTPSVSYSAYIGGYYPYYYPYSYGYGSCYPRYYGYGGYGGYCAPRYSSGYYAPRYSTGYCAPSYASSRGYAGVSSYRAHR
ncbi:MAG TPA: hypothetical protein VE981_20075 [Planctomycetota bacterium]|nr:hypothetical protein [Planctomycetota bacterium]